MDFEALEKLRKDVSALQKRQTVMVERLEKLNEKSDTVSEVVFEKIFNDYQHKLEQLNMELSPLYDQLKLKKAELVEAIADVEDELKAYMVEKEEISVRAELGEYTEKKAASKIEVLDKENEDKFVRKDKLTEELEKVNEVLAAEVGTEEASLPETTPQAEVPEDLAEEFTPGEIHEEVPDPETPTTLSEELPAEELLPPPPPENAGAGQAEKTILDLGQEVEQGSTVLFRPPTLTIVSGNQQGSEFILKMGVTNIGSGPENDIRMDDPSIAEKHAQVTFGPDGFTIYDYNTPGGILVNGQRITEHLIQSGDKIQIGDIELRFDN